MLFGTTRFTCTKCGNEFESLMMEYRCTPLIAPMPCLQCGSIRTLPKGHDTFFGKNYLMAWMQMDKDSEEAEEEFEQNIKLAEQGDAEAQFIVGYGYELRLEAEKAVEWYRKAAEQGHISAHLFLAGLYELGDGIDQNKEEAIRWYQRAAKLGDKFAKKKLKRLIKRPSVFERIRQLFTKK